MRRKFKLTPTGTPSDCSTPPMTVVDKGWGRATDGTGEIFAYHPCDLSGHDASMLIETVKLLHIAKGKKLSRHFHLKKREIFVIAHGSILLELWDRQGAKKEIIMQQDTRVYIPQGCQHRMTGLDEENILLEISTLDIEDDSYRIEKGD